MTGALQGLKILDLSRILAGPSCTQLLGDLGAEVIKVEMPGRGDDTRRWGPPFLKDEHGEVTAESAYYACANRNKRSIAIDMQKAEGAALLRRLAGTCDVVIENFKVHTLERYGLDYASLRTVNPALVMCSITGFGQSGPRAAEPGYDFLIQAMGGLMSITGDADGEPMKVGVGIADLMCGMYAAVAILSALRHRDATGEGQYIDLALFDSQLSWLANVGLNYLTSEKPPARYGNAHPNIVPYQTFPSADGHVVIAVGNDRQFAGLCEILGAPELAERFPSNASRLEAREEIVAAISAVTRTKATDYWVAAMVRAGVPGGAVNDIPGAFADPQAEARDMIVEIEQPTGGAARLIANPLKLSATPVCYTRPPPRCGEHTDEIFKELLGLSDSELEELRSADVIA